jgi:hypothetical protein
MAKTRLVLIILSFCGVYDEIFYFFAKIISKKGGVQVKKLLFYKNALKNRGV